MPSEAALLATLTEKFYGSWAFRTAGAMLVVAALFAIGGTVLIGGQTINVRKDLEQSADRAKKDIVELQQSTVAELNRGRLDVTERMKDLEKIAGDAMKEIASLQASTTLALTSARDELNRGRKDFANEIDDGKRGLKAMIEGFESYAGELKERAVVQVVRAVQESLKEQESGIRAEILAPLERIRDEDIVTLRGMINSVSGDVGKVRDAAKDHRDALNALGPALNQLRSLAGQSDQIARTVESIKSSEPAARDAVTKASDHARRAADYEQLASKAETAVLSVLTKVSDEAEARQRLLGKIEFQSRTLENGVASLENDAAQEKSRIDKVKQMLGDVDRTQDVMRNLRERLAGLEPEVNAVRTRTEKASVVLDRAEPALWNIAKSEETIRWMGERLGALQAAIDERKSEIDAVLAIIGPAKKSIVELGRVEEDVKTARNRLDQLQPEIETIVIRVKEASLIPKPPLSKIEAELTWDEWKVIQQALATLGHDSGLVDGKPGKKTRRAIRSYQNSRGEQPSGRLTPEQIPLLLKGPANRKETTVLVH
ncbi:MAG: peptidoglycan-binding protein [Candidatus Entotheonellia bacterium]